MADKGSPLHHTDRLLPASAQLHGRPAVVRSHSSITFHSAATARDAAKTTTVGPTRSVASRRHAVYIWFGVGVHGEKPAAAAPFGSTARGRRDYVGLKRGLKAATKPEWCESLDTARDIALPAWPLTRSLQDHPSRRQPGGADAAFVAIATVRRPAERTAAVINVPQASTTICATCNWCSWLSQRNPATYRKKQQLLRCTHL